MDYRIDPDVVAELRTRVINFHEGPNDVLRRLLSLPARPASPNDAPTEPTGLLETSDITNLLDSPHFRAGNSIERYLRILSFLQDKHREQFAALDGLAVGKRIHLCRDPAKIEASGVDTVPKPIPGSPLHVLTRLSNADKRRTLDKILRRLDYPQHARNQILNALPDSGIFRPRSSKDAPADG